jgi:hypothetical protein
MSMFLLVRLSQMRALAHRRESPFAGQAFICSRDSRSSRPGRARQRHLISYISYMTGVSASRKHCLHFGGTKPDRTVVIIGLEAPAFLTNGLGVLAKSEPASQRGQRSTKWGQRIEESND